MGDPAPGSIRISFWQKPPPHHLFAPAAFTDRIGQQINVLVGEQHYHPDAVLVAFDVAADGQAAWVTVDMSRGDAGDILLEAFSVPLAPPSGG